MQPYRLHERSELKQVVRLAAQPSRLLGERGGAYGIGRYNVPRKKDQMNMLKYI